jgi:hypothetical protein
MMVNLICPKAIKQAKIQMPIKLRMKLEKENQKELKHKLILNPTKKFKKLI